MKTSVLQRDRVESFDVTKSYQQVIANATTSVTIAPVLPELALAGDRYYITVRDGENCYHYPIQFTADEARRLYPAFADIRWQFDDEGKLDPAKLRQCDRIVAALFGGAS